MTTENEIKPAAPAEGLDGGRCAVDAGSANRLAMAEACLAEIRAMMPREWEGMELPWCVLQMARDKRRMDGLERVLCYAMVCLDGKHAMESLPATGNGWTNGQLRAAIDKTILSSPNVRSEP